MMTYFSTDRGKLVYVLLLVPLALVAGFVSYIVLTQLQKIFFQTPSEVLYYGGSTALLSIFLGSIVALSGMIVKNGISAGKIKSTWRLLALYVFVACGTVFWLAPGALLNFLKVSGDQITVSGLPPDFIAFHYKAVTKLCSVFVASRLGEA